MLRKCLVASALLVSLSACAATPGRMVWRVRDIVRAPAPTIALMGPNERIMAQLNTRTVQKFLLAHFRITRAAGVSAELVIVDGEDPNAFAGMIDGRHTIGVNIGMLKLIGEDVDEFAYLVGHEVAHLAKRHAEVGRARTRALEGIGTLAGIGLGAAGVPAGGAIAGLAVDLVGASYSRDQEREADALGLDYMGSAGFNPQAAIRLQEKFLKGSKGPLFSFLSSHPTGEERIENLKALLRARERQKGLSPAGP